MLCVDDRYGHHGSGGYMSAGDDPYAGRRMNLARRLNAVNVTRRMAAAAASHNRGYVSDSHSLRSGGGADRHMAVLGGSDAGGTAPTTPSTLRRNVSAFGEITVMPVGDNEDEELKIAVEEHVLRD